MNMNSSITLNPALMSQTKSVPDINMKHIEETARDFEAMFMSEMMKPMFESIKTSAPFGGGKGEEIFRGFLRDEYGKMVSISNGGLGVADLVKQQLIEMQSKSIKPQVAQNMHGSETGITAVTGETKDVL